MIRPPRALSFRYATLLVVLWGSPQFLHGIGNYGHCGEGEAPSAGFDQKTRTEIDALVRAVGNIKDGDVPAKQDAAFADLLKKVSSEPLSAFWAQRLFYLNVLRPRIKTDGPERADAFLRRFAEWAGKTSPEGKARFAAFQMAQFPPADWPDGLLKWVPAFANVTWEDYDQDYFRGLMAAQKLAVERPGNEDWLPWIGRWRDMEERLDAHPSAASSVVDGVGYLWGRPLTSRETERVLDPLMEVTRKILSRPQLNVDVWRRVATSMVNRLIAVQDRQRLTEVLAELAEQQPNDPWIPFWRAEALQMEPASVARNAQASRLRAEAVASSLNAAPDNAFEYGFPGPAALTAESQAALAEGRWDDALGLARARFNLARDEKQAQSALDLAGQALVGMEGHWVSARRLLGFVQPRDDEDGEPLQYWMSAQPGDAWWQTLAPLPDEAFSVQGEAIRRQVLAQLVLNKGDEALALAATVFHLPELDARAQNRTMDLLAMALRAQTGTVSGADAFIAGQRDSADPAQTSAAPKPAQWQETEKGRFAAWSALTKSLAEDPAGKDVPVAMRDYAAWLAAGGDLDGSLAVMRALWAWSLSPAEFTLATQGVASALKACTGRLAVANQYLLFQRHGPAGPDGKPGTEDDLVDPLAEVPWQMPPEWTPALLAMAEEARTAGADRRPRSRRASVDAVVGRYGRDAGGNAAATAAGAVHRGGMAGAYGVGADGSEGVAGPFIRRQRLCRLPAVRAGWSRWQAWDGG